MLADGVINMVVAPEVSSIDPTASIVINNLTIPGLQTRRAKTVVELRDGESFALAGLIRKDFQDTIRQVPLLGSIPIIGTLFRSTGFQHEETELVIIVTPRLVRPVRAGSLKVPTDRVGPPNEADLLLNGRTDTGVPPVAGPFVAAGPPPPPPPARSAAGRRRRRRKADRFRKGLWPCPLGALRSSPRLSSRLARATPRNRNIGDEDPASAKRSKYDAAIQTINPDPVYPAGRRAARRQWRSRREGRRSATAPTRSSRSRRCKPRRRRQLGRLRLRPALRMRMHEAHWLENSGG